MSCPNLDEMLLHVSYIIVLSVAHLLDTQILIMIRRSYVDMKVNSDICYMLRIYDMLYIWYKLCVWYMLYIWYMLDGYGWEGWMGQE